MYVDSGGDSDGPRPVTVDLVLLVDNSPSMVENAQALGLAMPSLVNLLVEHDLDARVGIASVSVELEHGATAGLDPGEAGSFYATPVVVDMPTAVEAGASLRETVLCDAVAWGDTDLPSDPDLECSDAGLADATRITSEYLACACGPGGWNTHAGSGNEEPLEAGLLALCRGLDEPPDVCFDPDTPFSTADVATNADWLRAGATVHILHVSDEGDNSRRLAQGDDQADLYLDAFDSLDLDVSWTTIGPDYDGGDLACVTTAVPTWSVARLLDAADSTGGVYETIADDDCAPADPSPLLSRWVDGMVR